MNKPMMIQDERLEKCKAQLAEAQCRQCGSYFQGNTSTLLCYNCLEKELEHYKRAFEEVCRQFNYGDEKDYQIMLDSFWQLTAIKTGGEA